MSLWNIIAHILRDESRDYGCRYVWRNMTAEPQSDEVAGAVLGDFYVPSSVLLVSLCRRGLTCEK